MAKLAQPRAPHRGCADARSLSGAGTANDSMRSHDMHQVLSTHLESTVMTHLTELAYRPRAGPTVARSSGREGRHEGKERQAETVDKEAVTEAEREEDKDDKVGANHCNPRDPQGEPIKPSHHEEDLEDKEGAPEWRAHWKP